MDIPLACLIGILGLALILAVGTLAHGLLEGYLDKKIPERLNRFRLDIFKEGVEAGARKLTIDKKEIN